MDECTHHWNGCPHGRRENLRWGRGGRSARRAGPRPTGDPRRDLVRAGRAAPRRVRSDRDPAPGASRSRAPGSSTSSCARRRSSCLPSRCRWPGTPGTSEIRGTCGSEGSCGTRRARQGCGRCKPSRFRFTTARPPRYNIGSASPPAGVFVSDPARFALQLCREQRAVRLNLDEWMTALFRPDRPDTGVLEWYIERTGRCIDQIWRLTERMLEVGTSVVLEIGLIRRDERERFYERVDAGGHPMTIHVLDAPRDLRRERVQRRNQQKGDTFSMVVPPDFFEFASDMWQPLDDAERDGRDVRIMSTGS
ncbi:AAA family ATPase [Sorangium sp. So ce1128]